MGNVFSIFVVLFFSLNTFALRVSVEDRIINGCNAEKFARAMRVDENLRRKDENNETLLHLIVRHAQDNGEGHRIRMLIEAPNGCSEDLMWRNNDDETAIELAVKLGKFRAFKSLLLHIKALPDMHIFGLELVRLARLNRNEEMIRALASVFFSVAKKDHTTVLKTLIEVAIEENDFPAFSALLPYVAKNSVVQSTKYGWGLVHLAARWNRLKMIKALYRAGFDIASGDAGEKSWTPADVALWYRSRLAINWLKDPQRSQSCRKAAQAEKSELSQGNN